MIKESTLRRYLNRGLTLWQIMGIESVSRNTVRNWMSRYGIESPKGFFSRGLPVGRPPGTPMAEDQKELRRKKFSGPGNPFYGQTHSAATRKKMSDNHADISGERNPFRRSMQDPQKRAAHKKRCKELWNKRDAEWRRRFGERLRTGYGEITGTFWANVRNNAKVRGIDMCLKLEDAWKTFLEQDRMCALSGVPIGFDRSEITASLDRIDSDGHYTPDNVQWVHKTINLMKGKVSQEEFVYFCNRVAQCQES